MRSSTLLGRQYCSKQTFRELTTQHPVARGASLCDLVLGEGASIANDVIAGQARVHNPIRPNRATEVTSPANMSGVNGGNVGRESSHLRWWNRRGR